jgi:DNA end-binding protein Ku
MAQALWSGNLRLSLVLIPVKLYSALSTEGAVPFRMIHAPSGKPIRYVKGIETDRGFKEVPEEDIVKGYEHTKGQHVLIKPEEIEDLRLEAKHTISMERFVDTSEIDGRHFEKPYYLCPDGDDAVEGYAVMREALAKSDKIAVGQIVMGGRQHIVGIMPQGKGLTLTILRYAHEVRDGERLFDSLDEEVQPQALALAEELIEKQSGTFEPETMPNLYAEAVRELVQTKVARQRPSTVVELEAGKAPPVVNIMKALKESIQVKGREKVRTIVRARMQKREEPKSGPRSLRRSTRQRQWLTDR